MAQAGELLIELPVGNKVGDTSGAPATGHTEPLKSRRALEQAAELLLQPRDIAPLLLEGLLVILPL